MAKQPNWSQEELECLKEAYPKFGRDPNILEFFPGRTIEAICLKASRIGLKVEHNVRKKRTHDEYISLLDLSKFLPLEEYKGSTIPILHLCNICNHEWRTRPQALLRPDALCPICSNKARYTTVEEVDNVLKDRSGLIRRSEYTGTLDPLEVHHPYCGYTWTTKYTHIQQGSGCPKCNVGFGRFKGSSLPPVARVYVLDVVFWSGHRSIKIGITSRDLQSRLREITSAIGDKLCNLRILRNEEMTGKQALELEREILNLKGEYSCPYEFPGSTEFLSEDTLSAVERTIDDFIQRNVHQ